MKTSWTWFKFTR